MGGSTSSNAFALATAKKDTFAIHALMVAAHTYTTQRRIQQALTALLAVRQGPRPHEELLMDFVAKCALVRALLESKEHPGFVSLDILFRMVYINSVDQEFFARPIDRAYEEKKDAPLLEIMEMLQSYSLEHAMVTAPPVFGIKAQAHVADASSPAGQVGRRGSATGVYDVARSECKNACSHCWNNGYLQLHALANCTYFHRRKLAVAAAAAAHVAAGLGEGAAC